MTAYMIALNRRVHDRQKLESYWKAARPTFEGRGAKFLSSYTPVAPLELKGSLEGVVLLNFLMWRQQRLGTKVPRIKRQRSKGTARRIPSFL